MFANIVASVLRHQHDYYKQVTMFINMMKIPNSGKNVCKHASRAGVIR